MLNKQQFLIKERVAFMRLSDFYDIFDPVTGAQIGIARENLKGFKKFIRFIFGRGVMAEKVFFYNGNDPDDENKLLFSVHKIRSLFHKMQIHDKDNMLIGYFKVKLFSITPVFCLFDPEGRQIGKVIGDLIAWNFKFVDSNDCDSGCINKKWAGVSKELFTSADHYLVSTQGRPDKNTAMFHLAAALFIDMVYKRKR